VKKPKVRSEGVMRRIAVRQIRLVVEYDGSAFRGWQAQPRARGGGEGRSVQEALGRAIRAVTGEKAKVVGAGRTDAGVSALGQVACFETGSSVPGKNFAAALTAKLPEDVSVVSSEEVPPEFHPRRNVRSKFYHYAILNRRMRPAVGRECVAHVSTPLDAARMHEAARYLVGRHDFTSFAALEATRRKSPVREITRLDVSRQGDRITIECEGPGFLMHQVRTIVGSLIEVGRGKRTPEWIREVLDARDRSAAGPTAPARGLTLVRVEYGG
jgi:tRNA pseudouridine38-40 synthase